MGYERDPRGASSQGGRHGNEDYDYGRDYGSGRDYSYSSAREYRAAGYDRDDRDQDRYRDQDRAPYGQREYGNAGYAQRDRQQGRGYDQSYGQRGAPSNQGRERDRGEQYGAGYGDDRQRGYGRQPQGYDYDDRSFFARAGDEVRSWFGDEDAERRRDADMRFDERDYGTRARTDRDADYHSWRSGQIAALDRDYDDYRRENRSRFENEFSSWRTTRQGQRDQLKKVDEHMDVVGTDGSHVGTVDKVRGDRILLTKNDQDAGGRHHSIPCSWVQSVDGKVTLSKTADEAKKHWKDEENNQALFGDNARDAGATGRDTQGRILNRSFSGTY